MVVAGDRRVHVARAHCARVHLGGHYYIRELPFRPDAENTMRRDGISEIVASYRIASLPTSVPVKIQFSESLSLDWPEGDRLFIFMKTLGYHSSKLSQ